MQTIIKQLGDLYQNGVPIHELIVRAKKILSKEDEEVVQLIGEEPAKVFREDAIGRLVGITSGLVIFASAKAWKNSSGVLQRNNKMFFVSPFVKFPIPTVVLKILPNSKDPNYPFLIYRGNDYWGISKSRWGMTEEWLKKFLP